MILDLERFLKRERPYWSELESMIEADKEGVEQPQNSLAEIRRFHYLYSRASADLAQLAAFSAEKEIRKYLESLVARAYSEVHSNSESATKFNFWVWLLATFPQTVRRHHQALALCCLVMTLGAVFGGVAVRFDPEAKSIIMPFPHLLQKPSERVAKEEKDFKTRLHSDHQGTFSAQLMTHNTQVSIATMVLGVSAGVGTILMVFYNGLLLGAVVVDYVTDGQTIFLLGWLLPHGSVEIPSLIIAGQAGLVLGHAIIGQGNNLTLGNRLRNITPDLITLICGVALMLVWAGLIESFFSQYHQPILPYFVKIAFGSVQLLVLVGFLSFSGQIKSK